MKELVNYEILRSLPKNSQERLIRARIIEAENLLDATVDILNYDIVDITYLDKDGLQASGKVSLSSELKEIAKMM